MKSLLLKSLLPGLLFLANCDIALGKGTGESAPLQGQGLESGEFSGPGNPFLGKDWINDEGFIYTFSRDGTIFVEHHCGLEFDNQFSYVIWKNILVIYGTEMDNTDTLKAGIMTQDGNSIIFTTTANEKITYALEKDGSAPADSSFALNNVFTGTWQAGDERREFRANGILIKTASGDSAEYSYLVRKDRLVTLSHEAAPELREYRFEKSGNNITVNLMGGGNPLIYTPCGE
ncbi:MAG: hypothetical protein LBU18_06085 [Treponema sp.]|jgi:uncharacterized protein YkuJ|nr:hypothetical protein [Treponema sp.]